MNNFGDPPPTLPTVGNGLALAVWLWRASWWPGDARLTGRLRLPGCLADNLAGRRAGGRARWLACWLAGCKRACWLAGWRVHWGAPILAHNIVDETLLCGGELRRHRPKLCGGSGGELVAFNSRCQAGVLEPKWKRKRRHPETSAGTYRTTWASWLNFTCLK